MSRPWPEGLFVPMSRRELKHLGRDCEDVTTREEFMHIAYRAARVLYDLDFDAVTISGYRLDFSYRMTVSVKDENGEFIASGTLPAGYGGAVLVRAREGRDVRAAIRRDMGGDAARAWMEANGESPGFPSGTTVSVTDKGGLVIEVHPLW